MLDSLLTLGELDSYRWTSDGRLGIDLYALGTELQDRPSLISLRPLTSQALQIRVRFGEPRLNLSRSPLSHAVLSTPWTGAPLSLQEEDEALIISAGQIMIRVERAPLRLSYLDADGRPLLSEVAGGGVRYGYWDVGFFFDLPAEEAFYGLGQMDSRPTAGRKRKRPPAVPLDHRGLRLPVWHWHMPPSRVGLPLLLSSRGYGLLFDHAARGCWDLGAGDATHFSYTTEGGPISMVLFVGDSLVELLRLYTELTGRFPLPPKWSLGYLQSRYGYRDEHEVRDLAKRFRERELPCDGIILDLHWFNQMGDLAFDLTRWPDPAALIRDLRGQGYHVVTIEEPYLTEHSRLFPEARERGFLCRRPDGEPYLIESWPGKMALVDFTHPEARRWWAIAHGDLFEAGVEGHWLDLVEPMDQPVDMLHFEGPASLVHNRFADQMVSSVERSWELFASGERPFMMTRAGFPGLQRTGTVLWSGDVEVSWEALRAQVTLGQNAGMAGFAGWNSDVGGFGRPQMKVEDLTYNDDAGRYLDRPEDPELYVRWLQYGAFSPIFRVHCDHYRRREPWVFGEEIEGIVRRYLQLRYRMLPYLYSCFYQTYSTGLPIMRPLVLHYEDDRETPNLADQFLFGRDVLIAPVLEPGARTRRLYLPAGVWYDGWTEERFEGPQWIEVPAPLEQIPMFMRGGALIPFGPHQDWTGQTSLDPLTLHCYAGASGDLELYEDDGHSTAYRRGEYSLTPISSHEDEGTWEIHVGQRRGLYSVPEYARTLIFWLHGMEKIGGIQRDQRPLPGVASRDAWHKVKAGWWHYAEKHLVGVKVQPTGGPVTLHVWRKTRRGNDEDTE